jgi:predicted ATPase
MEKFIINNFRLFDNNFEFETPPITILTGKNNSGKSSFIKALLLFDDYISSSNQIVIDFTGNKLSKHKINSFDNAKNWNKGKYFSFTQKINNSVECSYQFVKYEKTNARLKKFQLNIINSTLFIKLDHIISSEGDYKITYSKEIIDYATLAEKIKYLELEIRRNENDIKKRIADPSLEEKDGVKLSPDKTYKSVLKIEKNLQLNKDELKIKKDEIFNLIKNKVGTNHQFIINSEQSKRRFVSKNLIDIVAINVIEDFSDRVAVNKVVKETNKEEKIKKPIFSPTPDYYFAVLSLFFEINSSKIHHLSPNRTKQERLYIKNHENTEIETEIAKFEKTIHVTNFIQTWLEIFQIGEDITIRNIEGIASMVLITENKKIVNLVDLGFGAGQILTILLKIANTINEISKEKTKIRNIRRFKNSRSHLIIIEEPESNLHPALQSHLAFLFIEVYKKYGIRFIIETHSEYFIRNLQLLIAENHDNFEKDEAIIYYMSNTKNEKRINKITINEDGSLSDKFGQGFLDEATKTALKLIQIKNKSRKI